MLRGQDGPPLEKNNSGLDARIQPDAIEPHATTAVYETTPALASPSVRSRPLDALPAGLLSSRARTAVPVNETTEQEFHPACEDLHMGSPSKCFSGLNTRGLPDALDPPLRYSRQFRPNNSPCRFYSPRGRSSLDFGRCSCQPLGCPACFTPLGLVLLCQRASIPPTIFFSRPAQKMEY